MIDVFIKGLRGRDEMVLFIFDEEKVFGVGCGHENDEEK
jgi:hypothetical protein